jgi:hypothetical protein
MAAEPNGEAEITVKSTPDGLSWSGDLDNPAYGGGYTIGFQSFEEFLREGPLRTMPEADEALLRRWVEDRLSRGGCHLDIKLHPHTTETMDQISMSLDGIPLKGLYKPHLKAEQESLLFSGTVSAGARRLRCAVCWNHHATGQPGKVYPHLEYEIPPETSLLLVLHVGEHEAHWELIRR